MRQSLSQTLSHFYPLAGRIRGNLHVECNDEGALYSEARVDCHLAEFLSIPDLEALGKFRPVPTISTVPVEEAVQVAVQVNVFSCGGIAICVSLLHKLADGTLIGAFAKRWASICNGCYTKQPPSHYYREASLLFPPRSMLPNHASNWLLFVNGSKGRAGRYVFDPSSMSKLKARASSSSVPNPTAIEALSAFMWKHLVQAGKVKSGATSKPSSLISHAVNLRSRMDPVLPEHSIGNIFWKAYAHVDDQAADAASEAKLVELLRKSLSKIDSRYLERMQGDEGVSVISKWLEEAGRLYGKCAPSYYAFSDWCKLSSYEVDFGWGKPGWVSPGCMDLGTIINGAYFVESASKGGAEVWLILDEEEMRALEGDQEFLAFASINPSISGCIMEE
ncbi:hypothetical protein CDL15_Pgr018913 [Punica granatum]|nr:hypothetical protein CDL15_Pgr018913 [Punica granatum]